MNGPEHYGEAERHLAAGLKGADERGLVDRHREMAAAQVHATLALAAAVAELRSVAEPFNEGAILSRDPIDVGAWLRAFEGVPDVG